ncbi:MAG: hypothetical protein ACTSQ8_26160 [Candidatus Helarchaeota archaeon]|nr:hypothetical protein [Candidatus Cloacimonadota bacterium]
MRHSNIKPIILIIAFFITAFGCKNNPTTPWEYPDLSIRLETEHFIFYYADGDYVESTWQEVYHEWAVSELQVIIPCKINYYKYWDITHLERMTGINYCFAEPDTFAVHTIWPTDNHECVHLYTSLIGRPSDFFNEGIAVAFQTDPYNNDYTARWNGMPVHYWGKKYKDEEALIPLDNLLETEDFRAYDGVITYPEAGSFMKFMIDSYGLDQMKSFFEIGDRYHSKETIKLNFVSVYNFSINKAEEEWLLFLDSY